MGKFPNTALSQFLEASCPTEKQNFKQIIELEEHFIVFLPLLRTWRSLKNFIEVLL